MAGPLCKVCGKKVPKHIRWQSWGFRDEDAPRTTEEAARRSNYPLVSVRLSESSVIGPFVQFASYWDGTYEWGGHFHAQRCAALFGESMAGLFPGYSMPAYKDAMAARDIAEKETA
jgi:hypothetical protein